MNNLDKAFCKTETHDNYFDVIVSNPPYQIHRKQDTGAFNIYHHFMLIAQKISQNISMIYPAKWTNSGQGIGLTEFRKQELKSNNYKTFIVESNSRNIFSHVDIAGGINYFHWTKTFNKEINYYYDKTLIKINELLLSNTFIQNPKHRIIATKINTIHNLHVYGRDYYGNHLSSSANIENLRTITNKPIKIYYNSSVLRKIQATYINSTSTHRITKDYKIFVGKTTQSSKNSLPSAIRIFIGKPDEICSSTFLKLGSWNTEQEAINCLYYLKTNFATFLLGVTQLTQNSSAKNYALIPDVDFATGEIKDKPGVFLNFDKPETLDAQLAKIYELTTNEQELMADSIKPWKDKLSLTADGLY